MANIQNIRSLTSLLYIWEGYLVRLYDGLQPENTPENIEKELAEAEHWTAAFTDLIGEAHTPNYPNEYTLEKVVALLFELRYTVGLTSPGMIRVKYALIQTCCRRLITMSGSWLNFERWESFRKVWEASGEQAQFAEYYPNDLTIRCCVEIYLQGISEWHYYLHPDMKEALLTDLQAESEPEAPAEAPPGPAPDMESGKINLRPLPPELDIFAEGVLAHITEYLAGKRYPNGKPVLQRVEGFDVIAPPDAKNKGVNVIKHISAVLYNLSIGSYCIFLGINPTKKTIFEALITAFNLNVNRNVEISDNVHFLTDFSLFMKQKIKTENQPKTNRKPTE